MSTPPSTTTSAPGASAPGALETTGLEVIDESQRHGRPSSLFWPWFAANISALGISYGAFVLGFGISWWQALLATAAGTVLSFLLCGFVSLAGKRGSAPTMVLSRAAFGVNGNRLPAFVSWLLLVGWETVLVVLATLASATVFERLGWGGGTPTRLVALVVVLGVSVASGVFGFRVIMRVQTWITVATGALTLLYMLLVARHVDLDAVTAHPSGSAAAVVGATMMLVTALGLGWTSCAADYSRYLPRDASGAGVVGWTTFGACLGPLVLVAFGMLLAGSDEKLAHDVGDDPIGALTTLLPTWFLVPFALVAVLGLIGGTVLDIYSSGLSLLAAGLRLERWQAALLDGVLVTIASVVVVFFAQDFIGPFKGFLITGGVPLAAWCGIFLGDMTLRRRDYADADLYDPAGRYGSVRGSAIALMVLGSVIGWGLVVNTTGTRVLAWQGYLLGPFGGQEGTWAYAALGVAVAWAVGFAGTLLLTRGAVRRQEALDDVAAPAAAAGPAA